MKREINFPYVTRFGKMCLRGHVQTIFGKINVIMTLRGGGVWGVACDANFFVCVLLSFRYYSKILLQLCQLYSTGNLLRS